MKAVCQKHGLKRSKWGNCSECRKEYRKSETSIESEKRYNSSEKAKATRRRYQRKYGLTPKGRLYVLARSAVHNAIRAEKLSRFPCQICNNPISFAHHLFGYAEEHWPHVVFLCREHHVLADHDPVFNEKLKSGFPPCA